MQKQQTTLQAFLDLGDGLTYQTALLFGTLLGYLEEGDRTTLLFIEGRTRELTEKQSTNFLNFVAKLPKG